MCCGVRTLAPMNKVWARECKGNIRPIWPNTVLIELGVTRDAQKWINEGVIRKCAKGLSF